MDQTWIKQMSDLVTRIHTEKPLIHHITNYVTVNDCANIVLAIGASPIMADDLQEVAAITAQASALVINIGTLNQRTIESMMVAGKEANRCHIPVIFDPVGAGASALRNQTTKRIIQEIGITVIRGNLSEICFIGGLEANIKGVDADIRDMQDHLEQASQIASTLAKRLQCTVAITGASDMLSDGTRTFKIDNGHPKLSTLTGTGCMCTSLIGSFCGVTDDPLFGACAGITTMGIAGEMAYEATGQKGNGSYHMAILDAVSQLNADTLYRRAKINEA